MRLMRSVQSVSVKTNYTAPVAGILLSCVMLASCSSDQQAFFAQTNALTSQGYKWQKLDKCRLAKNDALALPITVSNGQKLVCYTLVPPQAGTATGLTPTNEQSQITPYNSIPKTTAIITPAQLPAPPVETSTIIWHFSNF